MGRGIHGKDVEQKINVYPLKHSQKDLKNVYIHISYK
jgi:hypothetical protein